MTLVIHKFDKFVKGKAINIDFFPFCNIITFNYFIIVNEILIDNDIIR